MVKDVNSLQTVFSAIGSLGIGALRSWWSWTSSSIVISAMYYVATNRKSSPGSSWAKRTMDAFQASVLNANKPPSLR